MLQLLLGTGSLPSFTRCFFFTWCLLPFCFTFCWSSFAFVFYFISFFLHSNSIHERCTLHHSVSLYLSVLLFLYTFLHRSKMEEEGKREGCGLERWTDQVRVISDRSPGRAAQGEPLPLTPPISLFPLTSIFFFYSALHSSAPLPSLLFFPTFVAFKPDKGSLRIHFVCISACKCLPPCVYVCAHLCLSAQLISHEGQLPKVPLKSFQWLSITRAHMHTSERKHKRRPQKSFSFSPAKSTLLVIVGQCVIRVGPYLRIHLAFVSLLLKHHREGLLSTPFPLSHPPPIIPMCLQNLPATAYCPNEVVY